jgi:hypothetical protein
MRTLSFSSKLTVAIGTLVALIACTDTSGPVAVTRTLSSDASRLTVPAIGVYTQIEGSYPTCGLRNDGVIRCFKDGQVISERSSATGLFASFRLSYNFGCALRTDDAIECWGDNSKGQAPSIVNPPSGMRFVDLDLGAFYGCAVRNDGVIQCWGWDQYGEAAATLNASAGLFVGIKTSVSNTCGLTNLGVIECFGNSGHFTFSPSTGSFTKVIGAQNVCGIRTGGIVECRQTPNYQTVPMPGTWLEYSVSGTDQCGINLSREVWCVSLNGQPYMIHGLAGPASQIVIGGWSLCTLLTTGAIQCSGLLATSEGAFEQINPTATFTAPTSVIVGQPIPLSLTSAQVPGYPQETLFTYTFDCGSGSFSPAVPDNVSTASCPTSATGTRVVRGKVVDRESAETIYSLTVSIKSTQQGTTDLVSDVQLAPLAPDIRKALLSKLDAALGALAKGKTSSACSALQDFINQVNAQKGKAIPTATANAWILTAQQLRAAIGC